MGPTPKRSRSSGCSRSARHAPFCSCILYEPHAPYAAPPRFAEFAPYDAEIAYADEIIGRLVKYLKAHQLYDRSTIILVSDHGEGLGDHGEQEHGLFVYDDALRVPLIVKQAAGEGAGRRVERSGSAHRSRPDDSRPREGACPRQPPRAIAQAAARRHGPPSRTRDLQRIAVRPLSFRVERLDVGDRRPIPVRPGAARRALRSRNRIRASAATSPAVRRSVC